MTTQQIINAIKAAQRKNFNAATKLIAQHEAYVRAFMRDKIVNADIHDYYGTYNAYLDESKNAIRRKSARLAIAYLEKLNAVFSTLILKVEKMFGHK